MNYKKLTPSIFIYKEKAVKWFDNMETFSKTPLALAKYYSDHGADELMIFDLSDNDEDHEAAILIVKKISKVVRIPVIAGGNIKRLEDVKKFLYAGAKRAILNFSKSSGIELIEEAAKRFGKEKIAVSMEAFDTLFKQKELLEEFSSELIFIGLTDLNSIGTVTDVPSVIVTDVLDKEELVQILENPNIYGLSSIYLNDDTKDINALKRICKENGIVLTSFEARLQFNELKTNADGLIPVIVQEDKTKEILMLAYMNEEAFDHTVKTGLMTYYSRSRNEQWVKGETSGHYQYIRALTVDCDSDTLLASVDQIGAACHTGNHSCFFTPIIEDENKIQNPLMIFESVYATIADRKENPKEGSYTNYLLDKGLDKILKKLGEEATEIVIAAKNPNPEEIKYEISDFLYHAMVLMVERGVTWEDITEELSKR